MGALDSYETPEVPYVNPEPEVPDIEIPSRTEELSEIDRLKAIVDDPNSTDAERAAAIADLATYNVTYTYTPPAATPPPDETPLEPWEEVTEREYKTGEYTIDGVTKYGVYYLDADGNIVEVRDLTAIRDSIDDLLASAEDIPTFMEWMAELGYDLNEDEIDSILTNIDTLATDLQTITQEERDEASAYYASLLGMSLEEYETFMQGLTGGITGLQEDIIGGNYEIPEAIQRMNERQYARLEQSANRMVQNIMANTGSMTRALAAADNYTNNISDYMIQSGAQMAEDALAQKLSALDSTQTFMLQMVQNGEVATTEYLALMESGKAQALQAYATELSALYQENQQYLDMYQADLDALSLGFQTTYNGIMASLGLEETAMNTMQATYDQALTEALDQYEVAATLAELDASEETRWEDWGDELLGGILTLAGIVTAFTGVGGLISGGLIASGASLMAAD